MVLGPDKVYRPRGNVRQLFDWVDGLSVPPDEVLVEGPAGTGKSRGIGEFLFETAQKYANTKILVVRRFRTDLHKGFQRTFEDLVLYPGHPLLTAQGGGKDDTRESYTWPNRSRLVLGHMENPGRWYSSEWDIVMWNEANEARLDQWERLGRALRKGDRPTQCPWRLLLGDTNPDAPRHWLNLRCNARQTLRIKTKHADNPSLEESYLNRLRSMSGVRHKRLYLGQWSSAEGQIWDCFDSDVHVVQPEQLPEFRWYMAGMDFGYKNPGSLLVCGFDGDGTGYVIREVYRRGKQLEWWADQIWALHEQFPLNMIVADSAEPRSIDWLNERLCLSSTRGDALVQPVQKKKADGVNWVFACNQHVRSLFEERRLFILDDLQRLVGGPDPELTGVPRGLIDEIGEYVHVQPREGLVLPTARRENPDPTCADHSCNALAYLASEGWGADFVPVPVDKGLPDDTIGALLNHDKKWAALRNSDGIDSTFESPPIMPRPLGGGFRRPRFT